MTSSQEATAAGSCDTKRAVAAALALAALAAVVYLVLGPPGSRRDDVLIGRNAADGRRALMIHGGRAALPTPCPPPGPTPKQPKYELRGPYTRPAN
ncbi:hypothetical protein MTO96_017780 [Rhipicephalus appendiculatus]